MEESIKYFVPDISDIRVGYELEANMKFAGSKIQDSWLPITMKGVGQEVVEYQKRGVYRVPYLTKEQIEKEGWKEYPYITYFEENRFMKSGGTIHYNFKKKILTVDDEVGDVDDILFKGECKDINTFRYICKLLGI